MAIYRLRHQGMTLVEAILSLSFFALILGVSFLLCRAGWDSWAMNSAHVIIAERTRNVHGFLSNDLSQSGFLTVENVPVDGNWYHNITFKRATTVTNGAIAWGEAINYALGGPDGEQLLRTLGSASNPVADHVTAFDVRRQVITPNLVEVHITVKQRTGRPGNDELVSSLDFQVLMRN